MTGHRKHKVLTPADIARARQLYVAARLTLKVVALRMDVSEAALRRALVADGVEIDSKRRAS